MVLGGNSMIQMVFSGIETASSLWNKLKCHWCLAQVAPGLLSVFPGDKAGISLLITVLGQVAFSIESPEEQQVNTAYGTLNNYYLGISNIKQNHTL